MRARMKQDQIHNRIWGKHMFCVRYPLFRLCQHLFLCTSSNPSPWQGLYPFGHSRSCEEHISIVLTLVCYQKLAQDPIRLDVLGLAWRLALREWTRVLDERASSGQFIWMIAENRQRSQPGIGFSGLPDYLLRIISTIITFFHFPICQAMGIMASRQYHLIRNSKTTWSLMTVRITIVPLFWVRLSHSRNAVISDTYRREVFKGNTARWFSRNERR